MQYTTSLFHHIIHIFAYLKRNNSLCKKRRLWRSYLRLVQTCPKRSRVNRFHACVKCVQLDNSLSHCVLHSPSERGLNESFLSAMNDPLFKYYPEVNIKIVATISMEFIWYYEDPNWIRQHKLASQNISNYDYLRGEIGWKIIQTCPCSLRNLFRNNNSSLI